MGLAVFEDREIVLHGSLRYLARYEGVRVGIRSLIIQDCIDLSANIAPEHPSQVPSDSEQLPLSRTN